MTDNAKSYSRLSKRRRMNFVISERAGDVAARLIVDRKPILDFTNAEAPAAIIRYGRTDAEKLTKAAKFWSAKDARYKGPSGWLDFYIACRQRQVTKEILLIRKAIKRIEAATRCMLVAEEAKRKTTVAG